MRFLVDENSGPSLANWCENKGMMFFLYMNRHEDWMTLL
jgi:hypothetical protein